MKTTGMLGGMSWESTQTYYRLINEGIRRELGGLHSARIILNSLDFAEIESLQHEGDWDKTAELLADAAVSIQSAGADFLMICTNTMHKVAPEVEQAIDIPLLHIADATANRLLRDGVKKVGLLGTRFTMEQAFYRDRIRSHGIEVTVPAEDERAEVHRVIYDELCQGIVSTESRQTYLDVVDGLAAEGARAVILGCTEIGLLLRQEDTEIQLYDTTALHAEEAVAYALR